MGHPILGDPKYQTAESNELSAGLKLQLHARRLVLAHPSKGQLVLEAPLSLEMRAGFQRFGFDAHEADPEPFKARPKPAARAKPPAKPKSSTKSKSPTKPKSSAKRVRR
jgi:23S rRNA pseudouridine955/2504/2580 synthase